MKLFAVTGNPIFFSNSPNIFNTFFKINNDDAKYLKLAANTAEEAIKLFNDLNLSGMSVTAPFKTDIMPYLDEIDDLANNIGSVNTIIRENNKLIGFNTDYYGVLNSLSNVSNKKVLVLGAGGAAKAVIYSLSKNGAKVIVTNRTLNKAKKLSKKFKISHISINNIESKINNIDIIINTIPNGIKLINDDWLNKNHIIFDAIYNNSVYKAVAKEKHIEFINGRQWLLNQAIIAYKLFFKKDIKINANSINFETKQKDKIIFIGFMGSGKSSIAEKTAKKYNIKHFSTDDIISNKENLSINEIFKKYGEKYFRDTEKEILSMLSSMAGKGIISTGGGAVLNKENRAIILNNYISIWLYADIETIMKRTKPDNRPLLKNNFTKEYVTKLMNERINYYAMSADIVVNTSNKNIFEVINILSSIITK